MPSILFVHGAAHGAWCWRDYFTGWFEARGFTVVAPDLPHHGDLECKGIRSALLKDNVGAVADAAVGLDRPLIIVGNSLGGFWVQKYLENAEADLAVLLASLPPSGNGPFVKRLARRHPVMFLKAMFSGIIYRHLLLTDSPERTRELFFSPETPAEVVENCHRRLQPESIRLLREAMTGLHPERITTPIVVIGGESDEIITSRKDVEATAHSYHTTPLMVPGGHDLMLDSAWEQVATTIANTIADHFPTIPT